jgi:hypothetical protein
LTQANGHPAPVGRARKRTSPGDGRVRG